MRLAVALTAFMCLATWSTAAGASQQLEGCSDPEAAAAALKALRDSDWKEISVAQLQTVWPTNLKPMDCDGRVCSSVVSEGRIINGEFECGEVFDFKILRQENGTLREQLQSIIIHYTARTREETVSAAKTLSAALGLRDVDRAKVGRDRWQQFQWETSVFGQEASVLGLQWNQLGSNWNLYLSFDRYHLVGARHGDESKKEK